MTTNVAELKPQKEQQASPKSLLIVFEGHTEEFHATVRWITSDDRFLRVVFTDGSERWFNSKKIDNLLLVNGDQDFQPNIGCL